MVGPGFTFGEGTFVTCWHYVSSSPDEDEVYSAAMRSGGIESQKYDEVYELVDLERDSKGAISHWHGSPLASIPSSRWQKTQPPRRGRPYMRVPAAGQHPRPRDQGREDRHERLPPLRLRDPAED